MFALLAPEDESAAVFVLTATNRATGAYADAVAALSTLRRAELGLWYAYVFNNYICTQVCLFAQQDHAQGVAITH